VLLISGARDSYVTPEIAQRLLSVIGDQAELWMVPGAKHNMSRAMMTEEYDRRIIAHAKKWLSVEPAGPATSISIQTDPQRPQATPHVATHRH
jgi:plasmid maintenance system antidote protein VapI